MASTPKRPWYAEGLHFQCQGCGDCCRGPGGYVWVTMQEAQDIAAAISMDFDRFAATMLRQTPSGLAIVDGAHGDCPLLDANGGCRVYHQRPVQCRTWPWWDENLASPDRWQDAATRCSGMNKGPAHSLLVIESERAKEF
ncbi:MAG: YkgJ family cysteine cluster protein [Planctomycetaceae bacterium]|nr:YkgJ family cysteine cluster protein [Planctomycetaceae bacterium]